MFDQQSKIRVVDDDPGMRMTLEGIIEDEGYHVVAAEDGYKAIELAKATSFDLIFMDVKMPGINGVDAYKEIKTVSPGSVVVMMTGFAVEELVKEALEEGAYAVIYKPLEVAQILDIVQSVLKTTVSCWWMIGQRTGKSCGPFWRTTATKYRRPPTAQRQ